MQETYDARKSRPVMTAGGIMPGGSEMTNWYAHIPFPSPAVMTAKRMQLLALIEAEKARKERIATTQHPPQVVSHGGQAAPDRAA